MLVEGNHEAALAALWSPSSKTCVASTVFPAPEMPTTIVVEPSKNPPPIKSSRAGTPITERLARGSRLFRIAVDRGLNAAKYLQALSVGNSQRVLAGYISLAPALDDLHAAMRHPLVRS